MKKYKYLVGGRFQIKGMVTALDEKDAEIILREDLQQHLTDFEITDLLIYEKKEKPAEEEENEN